VGNNTRIHETIERFDIVWIPLRIDSRVGTFLQIEHRGPDVRVFTNARLSFTVKVPDGFGQCFGNIRAFILQGVPNEVGGDYVRLATFEGSRDAEQSNNIRVICMEILSSCSQIEGLESEEFNHIVLPSICPVDADFVNLCWIIP
jgi:hypothetical protein